MLVPIIWRGPGRSGKYEGRVAREGEASESDKCVRFKYGKSKVHLKSAPQRWCVTM